MVGQQWESELHPHEDFVIYDSVSDSSEEILFWERVNEPAFDKFIMVKKSFSVDELIKRGQNTYPYAWAGECSGKSLKAKIKKYHMNLKNVSV